VNAFVLPSLGFGFIAGDDDSLMTGSLATRDTGVFWRFLLSRPVWVLSYPAVSLVSDSIVAQRIASLALWNACLVAGWRLVRGDARAPLVLLAIALHPGCLFPLLWIAQRNDLLLILFTALMALNASRPRGLVYAALSLLSKSPFVFQGAVYAAWLWVGRASRPRFAAAAALAMLALAGAALVPMYSAYYAFGQEDPIGLYQIADRDPASIAFVAAARAAKLVESAVYAFVPLPAFHGSALLPLAVVAYAFGWGALLVEARRGGLARREHSLRLLALAAAMALPLAFGTGLRVVPPLVFFAYLGLLPLPRASRLGVAALTLITVSHAAGSLLNYRFSDTGCHDLARQAGSPACGHREAPIYRFQYDRQAIVDDWVRRWLER